MATTNGNVDVSYTGLPLIIRFLGDVIDGMPLTILVSPRGFTVGVIEKFVNERAPGKEALLSLSWQLSLSHFAVRLLFQQTRKEKTNKQRTTKRRR